MDEYSSFVYDDASDASGLYAYEFRKHGNGHFITAGSAIVGTTWAIINLRYTKKDNREREQMRLNRYEEYLVQCADRIRSKF